MTSVKIIVTSIHVGTFLQKLKKKKMTKDQEEDILYINKDAIITNTSLYLRLFIYFLKKTPLTL